MSGALTGVWPWGGDVMGRAGGGGQEGRGSKGLVINYGERVGSRKW